MMHFSKSHFRERCKLFDKIATIDQNACTLDTISFNFEQPNEGIINMNVSANGEQKLTVPFKRLTNLSQFVQIREWLEKVVKEDNIECCARIAVDGQRDLIFHYEILYQSYVGSACMNGNSVKYDASSNPSIGLFYIFDFNTETIPVYTIGYTIDFVRALYYALFDMCCKNGNGTDNFITEWYFYENYDYFKWSAKYGMWNFYHDISSSIIDSYNGSYFRHK